VAAIATIQSRSPYRPAEVLMEAPAVDGPGLDQVLARGRRAAAEWRTTSGPQRAAALVAGAEAVAGARDELVGLMIREVGKPRKEAEAELASTLNVLRYFAQQALDPDGETYPSPDGRSLIVARRRPLGLVTLITPWNFPLLIPAWKTAPALAFGNAVVLKPSSEALAIAMRFGELLAGALPADVLQVVPVRGGSAMELVRRSDAISFTGSSQVGAGIALAATEAGIPVQAEMGGHNASIVLPDADVERAARLVASSAMAFAGQKCTATRRVIVVGEDRFTPALQAAVSSLGVGDPMDAEVAVGPVINEDARGEVLDAVARVKADGGQVLTGGRSGDGEGWIVQPTLVTGVSPNAFVAQEEVFGPLAVILPARDLDEALEVANSVRYGLAASIYTKDLDNALLAMDRLETGLFRVNAPTTGAHFYVPFGGEKASGYGPRENGKAARDFYTKVQSAMISPS
jgi:alpha-ketoglutaric semialdehyde dehydrogenase